MKIVKVLRDSNIFAQIHYIPVYLQPYYFNKYNYKIGKSPIAEKAYSEMFSIPLYPSMSDIQIDFVIKTIIEIVEDV